MKKRVLSILLALGLLANALPGVIPAMAEEEATEEMSTIYAQDRQASVTEDPLPYETWAREFADLDNTSATYEADLAAYLQTEAAKAAYTEYYFSMGRVVWYGDWKTGIVNTSTGVFEPVEYHTQFVSPTWTAWNGSTWYSTKSVAAFFLKDYLDGKTVQLWGYPNHAYHINVASGNTFRFSGKHISYFAWNYTVPADMPGQVELSIVPGDETLISADTRICIMKNDTIIWPKGAVLQDSTTWYTNIFYAQELTAMLQGELVSVEEGDQIRFVMTDGETRMLNPKVTYVEDTTWKPTESTSSDTLTVDLGSKTSTAPLSYEEFCAQALDPNLQSSKDAFEDYVMEFCSKIEWTKNWSAGEMLRSGEAFSYEPIAYQIWFAERTWDQITDGSRFTTASTMRRRVERHLIDSGADGSDDYLWGSNPSAVYAHKLNSINYGPYYLLNNYTGSLAAVMGWTYDVPEGVTQVTPSMEMAKYSGTISKIPRFCIMKNGTPIWPATATSAYDTWAKPEDFGCASNNPTAEELNAAWKDLDIAVAAGDQISVCVRIEQSNYQYGYVISMTDQNGNKESYSDTALVLGEKPITYTAFCAANCPARAAGTAYAKYAYRKYCLEQMEPYAAFCAKALNSDLQSTKAAYIDYVMRFTSQMTWSGNWSIGDMLLKGDKYEYDPMAYQLWFRECDWDHLSGGSRFVTASGLKTRLERHLIDFNGSGNDDYLWGTPNIIYGTDGGYTLTSGNRGSEVGVPTWNYTVPSGVTEVAPQVVSYSIYANNATASNRFCLMKNGVPVWPAAAIVGDPNTWAKQEDFGWAGYAPTADELNAAWKDLKIAVAEGDQISFCVRMEETSRLYKYVLSMTDQNGNVDAYIPKYTLGAKPATYTEFCAANSTARAEDSAYSTYAYELNCVEQATVSIKGDWKLGQMVDTDAAPVFHPFTHINAVDGRTVEDGFSMNFPIRFLTEEGLSALIPDYLAGNAGEQNAAAQLNYNPMHKPTFGCVAGADNSPVYAYRYTMPQTGRVHISIDEMWNNTAATAQSTYLCVMYKGDILWPKNADFNDPAGTWAAADENNLTALNESLAAIAPYLTTGESLDICLTDVGLTATGYTAIDPKVEIFTPLPDLFSLSAVVSLGRNFGISFLATYPNAEAAQAAEASFTLAGKEATYTTSGKNNADGTVTLEYYIGGIAARGLTEEVGYSISCETAEESHSVSSTTTMADVVAYHLKKNEDGSINTKDRTSALALATLNYAASVQKFFSYNEKNLANDVVPEAQRWPSTMVADRELLDISFREANGANLHFTSACLVLEDIARLKLVANADISIDSTGYTLTATLADGTVYASGVALTADNADGTQFTAVVDMPMLHYNTAITFGIYNAGGELISDEVTYGVGAYAKRMYGEDSVLLDDLLDCMLELGDAASEYHYNVENVLVGNGPAIPAEPGETIDLYAYSAKIGDTIYAGDEVEWLACCDELRTAQQRFVLAPSEPGEYPMLVTKEDDVILIKLAVCDENGAYAVDTVNESAKAHVDLSGYGDAAAAAGATVPDYWTWTLNVAAYTADQNAAKSNNISSFIFVTDTHHENSNKNTYVVANYLKAEAGVDRLIHGGDFMNGAGTIAVASQTMKESLDLINTFDGVWYAVRGNHDNNSGWTPKSSDEVWTDVECYENFFKYSSVITNPNEMHGYMDDPEAKIRYYFLDDNAYNPFKSSEVGVVSYADQLAWMQADAETLDKDWGVIVVGHAAYENQTRLLPVVNIIDKHHEVIAVMSGHTHRDGSVSTDGGYSVILTTCDGGGQTSAEDPVHPFRIAGTDTEQLMDLVQIDRENHKIYVTRIGVGESREFDY